MLWEGDFPTLRKAKEMDEKTKAIKHRVAKAKGLTNTAALKRIYNEAKDKAMQTPVQTSEMDVEVEGGM